jgi:predicted nucleotidyltransferase
MIAWYASGKYEDRLYAEDYDVFEKSDYDLSAAGARLLGSHLPALLDGGGTAELLRILDDHELMGRLAKDMGSARAAVMVQALSRGARDVTDETKRT